MPTPHEVAAPESPRAVRGTRRGVLIGLGLAAAAGLAPGAAAAAAGRLSAAQQGRLGVTTVSLRDRFPLRMPGQAASGGASLLDAPRLIRDELGLRNVELWNLQFEADTPEYCQRLRSAAQAAGASISNIQLDGAYDLSSTDDDQRAKSLHYVMGWMDRARLLGAPSVRANLDGFQAKGAFNPERTAQAFRQLAEYGRNIGVKILVENHVGHSVKVENVVAVLRAVNDPWCRAIADWGNSAATNDADRQRDIAALFPWLELVSAKALHFDAAGRHIEYDLGGLTRVTEASGFHGIYSIELFTMKDPPSDPIAAVRDVAREISAELAPRRKRA